MAIESRKQDEFFDELEIMPAEVREKYLNQRLSETVHHAYRHAPIVREIFDKAGVSPTQIRTTKDLEKLPIIRKTDLIELQRINPPYGGFITIPTEDIDRVFISPGPLYEPIQTEAIKWFTKSFWAAGFRKGDVVINTFTYHMSPAGILFHEALRDCGATAIPMGTGNTEIQIQTMYHLKVTGFVGTPTFLMTIIKRAEEMGYDFRQNFTLRRAWFTGEILTASLRKTLEDDYLIATAQAYAVTEPGGAIAYECHQKSGMHLMDEYIVEIVDPGTGKQLGPNQIGEIVVTPIHNKGWGLIRFGTGDMSSYITEPCPCGRTANRLVAIVGRTGDAIKVRGMFVVAKQAEQAVLSFEPISRFQIVVGRRGQRDEMTLKIELKDEAIDREKLADDLNNRFQNLCRVKIDKIKFVDKGSIPEEHQKIVDERTWE
ncbi:MAG TPA: phenylacetate--CoA ligase [Dehalococcoidia bacterium]|nr:phenylacetate--CoA ligase [Dehalococcoidia bacterium]